MEDRKTIFDYVGQIFTIYGMMVVILNIFCILFGEGAKEISTMFSMGNKGLSVATMMQYFGVAVILVFLRFLFFTDTVIKKMPLTARTIGMISLSLATVVGFILCFDWFPADMWKPWLMFFVCFGISFAISTTVVSWKEKEENRKMAEALKRLKQESLVGQEEE